MDDGLTWESVKAQAAAEREPRDLLERQMAQTGGNAELAMRLARACVRDDKLTEALAYYDHAELLGHPDAHAERRIVAQHAQE